MKVRVLESAYIEQELFAAIQSISFNPDPDIKFCLQKALDNETSPLAKDILMCMLQNLKAAATDRIPLCQDTGSLVVFADIGCKLQILGDSLPIIVNNALRRATSELYLRASMLKDPLFSRINTGDNTPAFFHCRINPGDSLKLKIAQKGGGAENMSRLKMFTPAASEADIIDFVVETVLLAGAKACPPLVIGVGIGGNFETSAIMAKEALLQPLLMHNQDLNYANLEEKMLKAVNNTGIGVQGMGGNYTAFAVHILEQPCHIASLPVAVNLQCHSHRHISIEL
ncbi:MAG: fumarate hydratase [Candidatus Cloacimonetes bacterium]|nr:fumarate hydratase [Candidatus Cloacimonadota bacterium]